jgi:hypothetical protein
MMMGNRFVSVIWFVFVISFVSVFLGEMSSDCCEQKSARQQSLTGRLTGGFHLAMEIWKLEIVLRPNSRTALCQVINQPEGSVALLEWPVGRMPMATFGLFTRQLAGWRAYEQMWGCT